MGDTLAKAVLFQAPGGPFESGNIIWDERPVGTPEGGVRRPFLWLPRPNASITIIYFHGNAEDLMDVETDLQEISFQLRVNILAVEYPGYGLLRRSESKHKAVQPVVKPDGWSFAMCTRGPENPSETTIEGIDKAAAHALAYVITTQGIPGSQVVLFGRSLGSGVALRLAKHARDRFHWSVGGVVLQCPYISIRQIVSDYACTASSFLIPSYYDNLATLQSLCEDVPAAMENRRWIPLLILHGEQDEIVWPYHGHTLHTQALKLGHPSIDAVFPPQATHNRWDLHEDIIASLRKFIKRHLLRPDALSSPSHRHQEGCFGPASVLSGLTHVKCSP